MKNLMAKLRTEGLTQIGGVRVETIRDIKEGKIYAPGNSATGKPTGLPPSNVLQFFLEDGTTVSARPSGTEPKIKFYISCVVDSGNGIEAAKKAAERKIAAIETDITSILEKA
jgi:phosphoglucomutase